MESEDYCLIIGLVAMLLAICAGSYNLALIVKKHSCQEMAVDQAAGYYRQGFAEARQTCGE